MSGQPSTPSTSKASTGLGKIFNKLRTPSGTNGSPSSNGAGGDSTPRSASPFGSILGRRSSSKSSLRAHGNNVPLPPSLNGSSTSLAFDFEDEPAFPTFDSDALPDFFQSSSASSSAARPGPYGAHHPSSSTLGSSLSLASSAAADDQNGAPFNDLTAQAPPRPGTSMSTRSRAGSIADGGGEGAGWKSSLLGRNRTAGADAKDAGSGSFGRALGRSLGLKGKETSSGLASQAGAPYGEDGDGGEDELTHKVAAVKSQDFAPPPVPRAPLTRQLSQEPPSSSSSLATTTPGLPRSGLSKSTTSASTSTAGPSAGTRRLFRTTNGGGERIVGRARRVVQPAATSTPESQPSFSESEVSSVKEPSPEPASSAQTSPGSSIGRSRPPISPGTHGRSRSELPPASPKMTQAERGPATVTIGPSHLHHSAMRPSSSLSHYAGSDADVSPPDAGSQLGASRLRPLHSSQQQQPLGSTAFRNRFLNSSSMNSLSSSSNQSPDFPASLSMSSSGATPSPPGQHAQPSAAAQQQQQPKIRLGPMAGGLSRKNSISMLAAVAEKGDIPPAGGSTSRSASLDIRRETVAARVAGQLAESRSSLDETRRSPPRDQSRDQNRDRDMMMPYLSRRTSVSRTGGSGSAADVSLDQSVASSATLIGSSGSSLKRSNSETITNGSLLGMARPGSSTAMYRDESQQPKPNVVRLAPGQQQEMAPPPVVEVLHDPQPLHYHQQQQQQHEEQYGARPSSAQAIHPYQDENAYAPAPSGYARHAPPPSSAAPQQPLPPHPASVGQPGRPVLAEVNRYAPPHPPSTQPRPGQPLYQKQQQQQQQGGPGAAAGHEYHVPLRDRSPGMAEATPSVTVQQAHYQSQQVFSQQQQQQMLLQQQQMMQMGYTPGAEQHPEKKVAKSFTVNGKTYFRAGVLGKGGSSRVYRVMTERNELYALKKVDTRNDAESRASFINEITLLRKLAGKPEIIQLLDSEVQGKYVIMVMEAGETDLAGLLSGYAGKAMSLNFIRYVWEQMLSAVQVIHDEAVVHTDLKPANFVLVKGRLKLIDFGISKAIAGDTTNIGRDQQIGTANYMPPEALNDTGLGQGGKRLMKLGRAADVWSLGCILYQMVYGLAPFAHIRDIGLKIQTIMSDRHRISFPEQAAPLDKHGQPIEEHRFKVGPDLVSTLRSCLLYDSKKRATIPELLQQPFLRRSGDEAASSSAPSATQYPQISDKMMEGVVKIVADQLVRGKLAQEDVAAMASNLMKQIQGLQDSLRT
ncbi:hypothetical protein JCM6882_006023 [Rhodosporidiobolus microsporus]